MDAETFNAFWMKVEDSIQNNKGEILKLEFEGCELEATHHFVSPYMGRTINDLTIIFTPKDIVWCEERKFWSREGSASNRYKITNSQIKSLKASIEKYLINHGYIC